MDMDTRIVRHVRIVRVCWVHIGGAGNVVVGSECVRWGCSKCARHEDMYWGCEACYGCGDISQGGGLQLGV